MEVTEWLLVRVLRSVSRLPDHGSLRAGVMEHGLGHGHLSQCAQPPSFAAFLPFSIRARISVLALPAASFSSALESSSQLLMR